MFENYSKHLMKHPKAVIAIWIVALMVALPFMVQVDDVMNYDMTSMGGLDSESTDGQVIVGEYFEGNDTASMILAVPYQDDEGLAAVEGGLLESGALSVALDARYGGNVTYSAMGAFGTDGSESGVFLVSFSVGGGLSEMDLVDGIRAAVSEAKSAAGLDGMDTYVTGSIPIAYDTMAGAGDDVKKVDPLSILLIIVLLGLFFWTIVTAAVPPVVVGTAYGVVLSLIFALGNVLDIFYITKTIVLVSMMGAGVDYSIFIISRYKEERKQGRPKEDALTEAVKWAGESVFTSGLAVVIGFAVMSFCSFSMVSTMAISLAIGIVLAMLAALTLIPAVIALVGDKVFWPRTIDDYCRSSRMRGGVYGRMVDVGRRYFENAGRLSIKHAKAIVVVAVLVTVPMAYVAVTSEDSFDMISVMPDSESKSGMDVITSHTDGGLTMPTYAVIGMVSPIAEVTPLSDGMGLLVWSADSQERLAAFSSVSDDIVASDDNVSYVMGPVSWEVVFGQARAALLAAGVPESAITNEMVNRAVLSRMPDAVSGSLEGFFETSGWDLAPDSMVGVAGSQAPLAWMVDYAVNINAGLVSTNGEYVQLMIVVKDEPMSQVSMDSVASVRSVLESASGEYQWIGGTWVVGTPAVLNDISVLVNDEFRLIELAVIVLIYLLLLFVLGVYLTPLRSLATILMGVVWTLGVLQLLFAGALGMDIIWIVPIVLFVICLGLGMDYDILVTTRIREGKLGGMSNDDAICDALVKSGPIITLCGLIMGGTFLTLLVSGSAMLQEIGFALGFAILVDALLIVPYVVPALMHLMGDWSWKGPGFLAGRRGE